MPQPLLVTDAPHLLYRAFYALPDTITNDDGMPVNALLGSANQTLWCVEKYSPRAVVFCFGAEAAKYRVEAYPDYHADRPPVPDKLEPQWERAADFYRAFGWTVAYDEDLEADDLLHSLAVAETEAGGHTLILTGDRDMLQCVNDSVTVLLQRARQQGPDEMDAEAVREMYGVGPEQVPDFIALRGDPSDGLPGRQGDRGEDGGRAAAAQGRPRARDPRRRAREAGGPACADRAGRRAALVQGHRDAAHAAGRAPAGRSDRLRRRRGRGPRAGHEPARDPARRGGGLSKGDSPPYGVNLTVITSPSAIG